jgi:hypothetical protein
MRIKDCHAVVLVRTICLTQTDRKKTGLILTPIIRLRDINFSIFITWEKRLSMDKNYLIHNSSVWVFVILGMSAFQQYLKELVFECYSIFQTLCQQ